VSLDWGFIRGADRSIRSAAKRLLLASILVSASAPSNAQTPPPVLPPTREEVTRPPEPAPQLHAPRLEVEGGIERAPCALDGPDYQAIRLTVRAVDFEGLQGLSAADLTPAYAPYVGHDEPIAVVCEIRDHAATILRNAGYIAAVEVPEQRIDNGVVRFRVLMAHLSQVRVRGNATGAERTIAGYLNQLTKEPVFNRNDAERYLLLASDIPGYTVRLTLRPAGTTPGEVIGDVTVQRTPAYVDFNIQNGGSRELGRWGGLLRGQIFGLTGLGDRTTLSLFSTSDFREQQTVQVGEDIPLGPEGLTAGGTFTYAWAKPDIPDANVRARTLLGTFQLSYPFVRRQAETLRGSVGMDYINQSVDLDHVGLSRDRLRVAFARLGADATSSDFSTPGYSFAEPRWHLTGLIELRQGLDIFGASRFCGSSGSACSDPNHIPPSRLDGHPTATVIRSTAYGEFRPIPRLTFALGGQAQYAWKPLLSFEQFAAGNYTVGRGYDPGALLGDRGWGTQAEIRFGSRVPVSASRPALEAYGFWDHVAVHNLDHLIAVAGSEHLNSVGGGARISFNRFALDAALAVPLTRIGIDNKRPPTRFLVSLTTRLWPWSYR
jgi:hemolysin activation/secretion protein